jgi:hypothetical protein
MTLAPALAIAWLDGTAIGWKWELKRDSMGLYRWYLDGDVWTTLRGATRGQAESMLQRFVGHCLRGNLIIADRTVS